jgi:hypothetical protein
VFRHPDLIVDLSGRHGADARASALAKTAGDKPPHCCCGAPSRRGREDTRSGRPGRTTLTPQTHCDLCFAPSTKKIRFRALNPQFSDAHPVEE